MQQRLSDMLIIQLGMHTCCLLQADGEEGKQTCEELGIEVIPTIQFWRGEKFLWEHRGYLQLDQDLGDGVASTGCLSPVV